MQEPHWIRKDAVLAMHDRQLSEHGGGSGVRDEGLLESALMKPQNLFLYSENAVDFPRLAASCAYGIAKNHPFIDGNKRTALVVSLTFLYTHGYIFSGSYQDEYNVFVKVASGGMSEEELRPAWFAANTRKV